MKPLKEATALKHKEAENKPFNVRMFKGILSEAEYLFYLIQQHSILQTIEAIGIPHQALTRVPAIEEDINELKSKVKTPVSVLNSTKSYTDYLQSLDKKAILPHVYLNYLALMFGGQMMKHKVPSTGKMYDFENSREGLQAIRNVQKDEWADEVNKAYDNIMAIFDELEHLKP